MSWSDPPNCSGDRFVDRDERTFPFERTTRFEGLEEMPHVMADPAALRTQYLGRVDELHCFSAELPPDAPTPEGFTYADLRMLYGRFHKGLSPDIVISLFGMATQVKSDDPDYDDVLKLKFGGEGGYSLLPWLATSLRLDHVAADMSDNDESMTVVSPRIASLSTEVSGIVAEIGVDPREPGLGRGAGALLPDQEAPILSVEGDVR